MELVYYDMPRGSNSVLLQMLLYFSSQAFSGLLILVNFTLHSIPMQI